MDGRYLLKYKIDHVWRYRVFFYLASICVLVSLSSVRSDDYAPRNDTYAYFGFYECVAKHNDTVRCKPEISSSKLEIGFDFLVSQVVSIVGENGFFYFKLLTSLCIYSLLLSVVFILTRGSLVALVILLLDYRFWAYGSNILRHGLAISIGLLSLLFFYMSRKKFSYIFAVLALLFHNSSLVMLFKYEKKIDWRILLFFLLVSISSVFLVNEILVMYREQLKLFYPKVIGYYDNTIKGSFALPLQYLFIIFISYYIYIKSAICKKYIIVFNSTFFIVCFSLMFSSIGMSERIIAILPPYIALLAYFSIKKFSLINGKGNITLLYSVLSMGTILLFFLGAIRNIESYFVHLNLQF
jgi:hypothetical protein